MRTRGRFASTALVLAAALLPGLAHASWLFSRPHLLPSPQTLPAGRLVYGTELALGVTDFFQVGTNVLRDFFKIFNASAKVAVVDLDQFALSPWVGFETYNLKDISDSNPDLRVTSWMPGAVAAVALAPELAAFVGGNLNFTEARLVADGITKSGYVRGARGEVDLSWAYNRESKASSGKAAEKKPRSGASNVLSGGVSYDFSYKLFGFGLSHHWSGFQLGVHFYPGAGRNAVQPILVGGGSVDL